MCFIWLLGLRVEPTDMKHIYVDGVYANGEQSLSSVSLMRETCVPMLFNSTHKISIPNFHLLIELYHKIVFCEEFALMYHCVTTIIVVFKFGMEIMRALLKSIGTRVSCMRETLERLCSPFAWTRSTYTCFISVGSTLRTNDQIKHIEITWI